MLSAAAGAIADLSDATRPGAALLPPIRSLRAVSAAVAAAVAVAAESEGLAGTPLERPVDQVRQAMWHPAYPEIEAI